FIYLVYAIINPERF
ncbi:MAG: K(+)-transporting ATPase subunit F, partial [Thermodesulfobacteriota bacterium]